VPWSNHQSEYRAIYFRKYSRVLKVHFKANVETKPKAKFAADASYVIAGGLGGLGRSFARWMVSQGVRNLILLSRSGAKGDAAKALVSELEIQGVCVATPQVDISDLSSLMNTLEGLTESMPPVKGCIQATVALRVRLLYL
jgi:hypothetical protein